ncbi:MAG: acyl-CoA dehydrogenase [bacterium]|nr:acyl-CoA dehydrogenase [bacterium]
MNFDLTEDQLMVKQTVREFAEKELAPGAGERDEKQEYPHEQMKKLGELGFMGVYIPEQYGGAGLDSMSFVITIEELARVDASAAVIVAVNNSLVCGGIEKFGTEEQKKKFLTPLASGQALGAYSLSEAGSGTDAASLKCRITPDGDDYIVNGTKLWVTNGANSKYYIVFTTLDPELGYKGICALLVDRDTEGFEIGKKENKLGIRSSDTVELIFNNARVPKANLLGEEGKGFTVAMTIMDSGRLGIAAQALGISQGAFEAALKYSKERKQFGTEIINHQAIQFKLAEMATDIDAGRFLTYRTACLKDQGRNFTKEASMAKMFCSQVANQVANQAVQVHGGYGYLKDFCVERFMRDAKITDIYEGTSEVQRIVIARQLQRGNL